MNLRQAYDGWSQQEQNRQLYVKTRDAFRRAWFTLPTNKPCSWYTKDVLALAPAETRVAESDKVKSASAMIHVLTWANFAEPKYNPKPDFEIKDVTRLIHLPADKLEKERQRIMAAQQGMPMPEPEEPTDEEETDLDIDPVTALPRRAMADEDNKATATEEPTATPNNDADPLEGIKFPDDNDKPKENTNMEQKRPRGKAPKPVAQIHPETLEVVRVWPSRGAAERELGVCNIDRAISRCRMAGGFYWCAPEDAEGFKPNPLSGKTVPKHQVAATEQPSTPSTLADFTDDELMAELDRRGFEGELSRRVVFTIGAK